MRQIPLRASVLGCSTMVFHIINIDSPLHVLFFRTVILYLVLLKSNLNATREKSSPWLAIFFPILLKSALTILLDLFRRIRRKYYM